MADTKDELAAFHHFAETELTTRGVESLHELVNKWESKHVGADVVAGALVGYIVADRTLAYADDEASAMPDT
jgi:hypothetical protein